MECKFYGDIGSNHMWNINIVGPLIVTAKIAGLTGVKFQIFDEGDGENDFEKESYALNKINLESETNLRNSANIKANNMQLLTQVRDICWQTGMELGFSFLSTKYVDFIIRTFKPDFLKVPHTRSQNNELIETLLKYEKAVYVSVRDQDYKQSYGSKYQILYCVSKYPARANELNLKFIASGRYNGYSSHCVEIDDLTPAFFLGARIFEKHIKMPNLLQPTIDSNHSITCEDYGKIIENIKKSSILL